MSKTVKTTIIVFVALVGIIATIQFVLYSTEKTERYVTKCAYEEGSERVYTDLFLVSTTEEAEQYNKECDDFAAKAKSVRDEKDRAYCEYMRTRSDAVTQDVFNRCRELNVDLTAN